MTFRHIGTESQIGDLPILREYGQAVELDETLAAEAILGNAALLPEADFKSLGFIEDELKRFKHVAAHEDAPATVKAKFLAGRIALHSLREQLAAGGGFTHEEEK